MDELIVICILRARQFYHSIAELQDKVSLLEKKLVVAKHDQTRLCEECNQVVTKWDMAVTEANSLRTALDEEQKRWREEEKSHQDAVKKAGTSAIEAFLKSDAFIKDLGELTLSSFIFGYTSTVNEVGPLLSQEDLDAFKSKESYNENAKKLCDRMADDIQVGWSLTEVREEFN